MQDCLEGSKPCHIRFRLVTAINLTTNWCTSEPFPPVDLRLMYCRPSFRFVSLRRLEEGCFSTQTSMTWTMSVSSYQKAGPHRTRRGNRARETCSIHKTHMHNWKRPTDQQDPMESILNRITRLKFVNSTFGFMNHACSWTGVARGRRPGPVAPCRTSTTGYTLWQDLKHVLCQVHDNECSTSYKANPINKTEGQQFKPKLITKQTPSTEPKVNS